MGALFAVVIAFSLVGAKRTVVRTSFDDYFLSDDPILLKTNEFKSIFGNDYYVAVLVRNMDILSKCSPLESFLGPTIVSCRSSVWKPISCEQPLIATLATDIRVCRAKPRQQTSRILAAYLQHIATPKPSGRCSRRSLIMGKPRNEKRSYRYSRNAPNRSAGIKKT